MNIDSVINGYVVVEVKHNEQPSVYGPFATKASAIYFKAGKERDDHKAERRYRVLPLWKP